MSTAIDPYEHVRAGDCVIEITPSTKYGCVDLYFRAPLKLPLGGPLTSQAWAELRDRLDSAFDEVAAAVNRELGQALDILTEGSDDLALRHLMARHVDAGLISPADIVARHAARDEHPS